MSSDLPAVRVFIGSGEASLLERLTLIHSIRQRTSRPVDLYVINGTHDAIERNGQPPLRVNLPLGIKYGNFTEFTNYRWLIPQICEYRGRAVYLDSDMICLGDIAELFDTDMRDCHLLARADAYGSGAWALSVMLIDCHHCRFDVETYFKEIDAGCYDNRALQEMRPGFLARHPFNIQSLDPNWNVFDRVDPQTKLIHFTDLLMQPWKFPGHKHARLWFQTFRSARETGLISDEEIERSIMRGYVRPDIRSPGLLSQARPFIRAWVKRFRSS